MAAAVSGAIDLSVPRLTIAPLQRYSADVFVTFSQLLTEMVLRLPYQVKKVLSAVPGSNVVLFGEVRARRTEGGRVR